MEPHGGDPAYGRQAKTHQSLLQGRKALAFSHLCGREDLIRLLQQLKQEGFITIFRGLQAREDYNGEPGTDSHPHRFRGLKSNVDIAFQGPVDGLSSVHLGMKDVLLEHPWTKDLFLEAN